MIANRTFSGILKIETKCNNMVGAYPRLLRNIMVQDKTMFYLVQQWQPLMHLFQGALKTNDMWAPSQIG